MNPFISMMPLLTILACNGPINHEVSGAAVGNDPLLDTGHGGSLDACDEPFTIFLDADGDGFGDSALYAAACEVLPRHVREGGDCDDLDATIFPGAEEECNGKDDDCDADVDEGLLQTFFADADEDGFGDPSDGQLSCEAPSGRVSDDQDCDDTNAAIFPGAEEACNGRDDDCDSDVDEDVSSIFFRDEDGDGFGHPEGFVEACEAPDDATYTLVDGDCDDGDSSRYPGAPERCDGTDDDCDGAVDEDLPLLEWFLDEDGDGFGRPDAPVTSCAVIDGRADNGLDCDDTDADIHPDAVERCNGEDDNCDGLVDNGLDVMEWFADEDGDGHGDPEDSLFDCMDLAGRVLNDLDCNDDDPEVHGSASERLDKIDNDCSGEVDDLTTDDAGVRLSGSDDEGGFGFSLAGAVDFDADDRTDLVVGAHETGVVKVFSGGAMVAAEAATEALLVLSGSHASFGRTVTFIEDLNMDGEVDLAVGSPAEATPSGGTGSVQIFYGPLSDVDDLATPDHEILSSSGGSFGDMVSDAGTLGTDTGFLAVHGSIKTGDAAGLYFYQWWSEGDASGLTLSFSIAGTGAGDGFGQAIMARQDLDGDGLDDLVVGAPMASVEEDGSGAAYIFYTPFRSDLDLSDADEVISGDATGDEFGLALTAVDDWDGDGGVDILLSAPGYGDDSGRAYLIQPMGLGDGVSASSLAYATFDGGDGRFGAAVFANGDLDGDGFTDVMIGAPDSDVEDSAEGRAFMYWSDGASGSLVPDARVDGLESDASIGASLSGIVDLSTGDLLWQATGGWGADVDEGDGIRTDAGAVWLFDWD